MAVNSSFAESTLWKLLSRVLRRVIFSSSSKEWLGYRSNTEFTLRSEVLPAIDILRSATSVNAELLGEEHQLGRVAPGYYADLIVVNGNPLANIELLASNGEDLDLIMRNGEVIRGL